MIIAQEKRKSNIAEYILYMWQIEDIIRASNLDIKQIETKIIDNYDQTADVKYEIREWYNALIEMMKSEKIQDKGHLKFIQNLTLDLNNLHLRLLQKPEEERYNEQYEKVKPIIEEFKNRSGNPDFADVEICLNGLYGLLLLRLQKKEVSKATTDAIAVFSKFMALLSQKYRMFEGGKLELL